jgi:hypothetical protein
LARASGDHRDARSLGKFVGMSRFFKVTIPEINLPSFQVPVPDGAALANSLKSRLPHQKKSASKLPLLVALAIAIVALVIVIVGLAVKKKCAASREADSLETEPDATSVVPATEES